MIKIVALTTRDATKIRKGGPDANGQVAERVISNGAGNPCRHCLKGIPEGEDMLVFAHRPFPALQPYA